MQKKVIALALTGMFAGVVYAQSNVTVYGVIDQGFTMRKIDNGQGGTNHFTGVMDGGGSGYQGSRFGFRGEEGLGNGLSAVFTLEYGRDADSETQTTGTVNTATNTSIGFTSRQTFVGLKSGTYGQFTIGRQYNAAADYYGVNSSNGVSGLFPVNQIQGNSGSIIRSQGGSARQDNMIKYVSPTFSGFTVRADYAFGEVGGQSSGTNGTWFPGVAGSTLTTASTDNGSLAISGDYTNGPLNVDLAYAKRAAVRTSYSAALDTEGKDIKEWYIGGGYDFKVVKVVGHYQQLKNDSEVATANTKTYMWALGAVIPVMSAGNIRLEYAYLDFTEANNPVKREGATQGWGIGYTHDLSKRTKLYTTYSQIKFANDTGFTTTTASNSTFNIAGQTSNNFTMGINHNF